MADYNEVETKQTFMGKLKFEADLLEELTMVCKERNIRLGRVEALGAVRKSRIGYYNQDSREYHFFEIDKHLEITKLVGNISIRDDKPMVHAHITLADSQGSVYGGHLAPGTIIFACEFFITSYNGPDYIRDYDSQTGLPLWKM